MTIADIRRNNARLLAKKTGTRTAFGHLLEMDSSQVSQIIGKNPAKDIGNSIARRIEAACGKPRGWMDVAHEGPDGTTAQEHMEQHTRKVSNVVTIHGDIEIPQYKDKGGSMGAGLLLRDQPGEIHGWRVTSEWLAKNVKNHSGIGNLAIVTGFGDSMRGMFNSGDPLLVDRGITSVEYDGVYFFRVGDEGFIKRLQRVPGEGLVAISENKSYRDWIVKPDMDFEVFARVVKVWIGTEF